MALKTLSYDEAAKIINNAFANKCMRAVEKARVTAGSASKHEPKTVNVGSSEIVALNGNIVLQGPEGDVEHWSKDI